MKDPLVFNMDNLISKYLDVKINNIYMNLYLQAVLRILGFLTDQLLPSIEIDSPEEAQSSKDLQVSEIRLPNKNAEDTKKLYDAYLAVKKPLWIKMNIEIKDTEVHMNMDSLFNERIRVYLGKMELSNDKFEDLNRILLLDPNDYDIDKVWVDRYSFKMSGLQIFLEERLSQISEYKSKELMQPFGMKMEIDMAQNQPEYECLFDAETICNPNNIYMNVECPIVVKSRKLKPRLVYDNSMCLNTEMEPFIAVMGNIEYMAVMRALEENVLYNDLKDEEFIVDYVKKEQEKKPSGMFINLNMDNIGFVCLDNDNDNLVDSKIYIDNMRLQLLMTPEGEMHLEMGIENLFGFYLVEHEGKYYEKGFINEFGEANVYSETDKDTLRQSFIENMKINATLFDRASTIYQTNNTKMSELNEMVEVDSPQSRFLPISEKEQKFYLKLIGDPKKKDISLGLRGLQILVETKTLLMLMDLITPKTAKDVKYAKRVAKRKWKQEEFMRGIQKKNKQVESVLQQNQGKFN